MDRKTRWMGTAVLAAALIGGTTAFTVASMGDDDTPLTGTALERASEAALEHTGGGTVVETEVGDGGAAYGVEVRLADGSVVEVSLDESFSVIDEEADDDTSGEDEGAEED